MIEIRCLKCGTIQEVEPPQPKDICINCGHNLSKGSWMRVSGFGETESIVEKLIFTYGGFWKRFATYVLDSVLLQFVIYVLALVVGFKCCLAEGGLGELTAMWVILSILILWIYFAAMVISDTRATVGKLALGIIVSDLHGKQITFGRASGRYFGKIISGIILGVGFIMAGFTDKKQSLHDIISDCLVIDKKHKNE
jgi:uncharacterized RDD family membrane protein YckC